MRVEEKVTACAVHRITRQFRIRASALHCCRSRKLLYSIRHSSTKQHICASSRVKQLRTVTYFGRTNVDVSRLGHFFTCRGSRHTRVTSVLRLLRSQRRTVLGRQTTLRRTCVRILHGLRLCHSVRRDVRAKTPCPS